MYERGDFHHDCLTCIVMQILYTTGTDWLRDACLCYKCALPEVDWPVSSVDVTFNIVTSRMCRKPVNEPLMDVVSTLAVKYEL